MELGYHASHEQFSPGTLLAHVKRLTGVKHAMCSDHFAPFSEEQGHSGFAWSWLGSALEATELTFGTVSAPGQRYHPAILAQASATLAEMYPGRFWLALGSGENLNEHITGERWPTKQARQQRLRECVDVMRALYAGETVTHAGLIQVREAKLYSRPQVAPKLFAAAVSAETAAWAASWADGLVTVNQPREKLARTIAAFRERSDKPVYLQVHVALAATHERARELAQQTWRTGALDPPLRWDAETPTHLDVAARFVRPEDMDASVRPATSLADRLAELEEDRALGVDRVYLHHVGLDQGTLLDALAGR